MPRLPRVDGLGTAYRTFADTAKIDLKSAAVTDSLRLLILEALRYLEAECERQDLTSTVVRKRYFSFLAVGAPEKLSRPVNSGLFNPEKTRANLGRLATSRFKALSAKSRQQILYTCAMAFCCANDLLRRDDRKTPGSFFEYFIGHLVARSLGINPQTRVNVLNLDMEASLPTDLIFDLGSDKSKLHLPVKLSTRERVIQVWAHQRVLDGIYGANRFKGVLVCMTETNLQRAEGSVVEICLPEQWTIYQMFIAQLARVYYLDPPLPYARLATKYPFIRVKPFAEFFEEQDALLSGSADA